MPLDERRANIYIFYPNFRDKCHNNSTNRPEKEESKVKYIQKLKYKVIKVFIMWLWKYFIVIFADFGVIFEPGRSLISLVIY
jgi:predicted AlkP superfamily pyrophosphatase or phosphodiesterase